MTDRNETITFKGTIPLAEAVELQRAVDEGRPVKLTGTIAISEEAGRKLEELLNADTDDMVELLRMAGLDPAKDLTYGNFEDVDWGDHDLDGYNFEGADLSGSNFSRAKVDGMTYFGAKIDNVVWPEGYVPDNGAGE